MLNLVTNMNKSPLPLLLVFALLSSGCAHVRKEKKTQGLTAATYAYGNALRWGYYDTAWNYLDPVIRSRLPPDQLQLKAIRLTGYEVVQPPLLVAEDQDQAEQWVQIDYVRQDTQVVRSLTDHQVWRYDEVGSGWRLTSDPPRFP